MSAGMIAAIIVITLVVIFLAFIVTAVILAVTCGVNICGCTGAGGICIKKYLKKGITAKVDPETLPQKDESKIRSDPVNVNLPQIEDSEIRRLDATLSNF